MCNAVSWWLVCHGDERKLLISENTDSHSESAKEFGIRDAGVGRVAAGEFWPDPKNPSPDTSTWKLVWDYAGNDRKPDWLDADGEAWLRLELEARCRKYVYNGVSGVKITGCRAFVFSSSVVARDSSRVVAWGRSSVVARDSSSVVAHDSSSVEARDSSRVVAHDSSSVEAWGSSSVVAMSKYTLIVFRKAWDGRGYLPVWCDQGGSGTFRATPDGFVSEERETKEVPNE